MLHLTGTKEKVLQLIVMQGWSDIIIVDIFRLATFSQTYW